MEKTPKEKREIKFRVWDGIDYMSNPFTLEDLMGAEPKIEFTKTCPVMQFTGLHDKNGKEIYEGDLIKHDTGEICKIEYVGDSFNYVYIGKGMGQMKKYVSQLTASWTTVIGNIYENPNLLN